MVVSGPLPFDETSQPGAHEMKPTLVSTSSPAPTALAAIVASITAWLDVALTQYRGAGASAFFRAALLANVSPDTINVSMIGPPGVAKTMMGTAFSRAFGGTFGGITLSPWTEAAELIGQVDIAALQAGRVERTHDPARPDLVTADSYLADEWSRSVGGTRAMLMSVFADRVTPTGERCTAHVIYAATNMRLTSEDDQAMNDRFTLRIEVPRLDNADDLGAVMFRKQRILRRDGTMQLPVAAALPAIPTGALTTLRSHARDVVYFPQEVADACTSFALALRNPGKDPSGAIVSYPDVSERRWVAAMSLLAASAALRGADSVDWQDMTEVLPMVYDEGEASRAATSAALTSSIPKWVGALRDLDLLCKMSVERAYRVAAKEARKGDAEGDLKRDDELDQVLATVSAFGKDVQDRARERVERAREDIDTAIEQGTAAYKARRAATKGAT